jgi:hypothetical protein
MNILEALSVRIPCTVCERFYEVPLNDILLSHQMLEQGCPVPDETECPPLFQTRLIPREVLHDFVKAWQRLEESVHRDNGELALSDCRERNGQRGGPVASGRTALRGVEKCSCRPRLVGQARDRGLDQTLSDTFPCSDALSSIPNPAVESVIWQSSRMDELVEGAT